MDRTLVTLCARLAESRPREAELDAVRVQIEQAELQRTRQVERCATLERGGGEAQRQLAEAEQAAQVVAKEIGGHDEHVAARARKANRRAVAGERQRRREEHAAIDKRLALAQSELAGSMSVRRGGAGRSSPSAAWPRCAPAGRIGRRAGGAAEGARPFARGCQEPGRPGRVAAA